MSMKTLKKGLGRGLGSLLGEAAVESVQNEDDAISSTTDSNKGSMYIRITDIEPNAGQPRRNFEDDSLEELTDSIAKNGILQPLAVRKMENGLYQIIAGERRWRAARKAGLSSVPAVVLEADDLHSLELAMIENLQREDLDPVEEAEGYQTLIERYGRNQEQVAESVGKSRSAVANGVRLLTLPKEILSLLSAKKITTGHARALLGLSSAKDQIKLAADTATHDLTVRQVENIVKKINQSIKPEPEDKKVTVNYLEILENELSAKLSRKVKIVDGRKHGRIELEYYGKDDLNELAKILSNLK